MPTTRVTSKHQITIPKEVFTAARLEVGDILDATVESGKVVFVPKRLVDKRPDVGLSTAEQRTLACARKKMKAISEDLLNSRGLTGKEVAVVVKAGLIPKDQAYFWAEEWQKDERAAEGDLRSGRVSPAFDDADEAIAYLHKQVETPTL
ncbi:MAG: AbrB/MazE/SpoVT family DNA-binding domain-containing protein [bacterium]